MNKALIIIDVQNDYFPDGKCELFQSQKVLEGIQELLRIYRLKGLPIYYVQHIAPKGAAFFEENTQGAEIHKDIKPLENERVIVKHYPNSFFETELQLELERESIDQLVICGMMTHMCVDSTVRAAKDFGYDISLISDGCTTKELDWKGKKIPADIVQNVYMASLDQKFAKVMTAEEYLRGISLIIRPETKEDYFHTEWMTKKAFWNLHLPGCDEHYLVHILRDSEDYIEELSRVAELDGEIVGAIYYSKAYVVDKDRTVPVLTFGPLCVAPEYQNKGIGGELLKETIEIARKKGYKGIIIFGEPGYYPKHGFQCCSDFGITTKEGKNFDAFMGYEIVENAFYDLQGRFYESQVFEQLAPDKVEEYDKKFPYMEKLKLPGQWS